MEASPLKKSRFISLLSLAIAIAVLLFVVIRERDTVAKTARQTNHYGEVLAIYLWDLDNESAQEYTDLIAEEGQFLSVCIKHPDDSDFVDCRSNSTHNGVHSFLRKVNLIRDINCSSPITHNGKTIGKISTTKENTNIYVYLAVGLLAVLTISITSLIDTARFKKRIYSKVKHDLTENQERLENVVSASPVIAFTLDRSGKFTVCEGMGLNKLHNKNFDIIGKSVVEVESHMPTNSEDFQRALKGDTFSEIRMTDGRSFETWYSPQYDGTNTVGVMGVATDVTAALKAMNSLRDFKRTQSRERKLAKLAHLSMLPTSAPTLLGYEIGLVSAPAETIGGDFIRFYKSQDQKDLSITFSEISGYGTSSALLASIFQTQLIKSLEESSQSLVKAFYRLNEQTHKLFPEGSFASTFHTVINSENDTMRYIKASREPAVIFSDKQKPRIIDKGGPAIGLLPSDLLNSASYEEHSLKLNTGDTLFLYSDGLVGIENEDDHVLERADIISIIFENIDLAPQAIAELLHKKVTDHASGVKINDDISILILRKL